jgi:hypothetical protein
MADDGKQQCKPGFKTAVENVRALATVLVMEAEDSLGRRTARFVGILALFVVVVGTLLFFLNWYIDPGKASERKDLVLTLAQILGGTALLSGLYFTWRTLQVNREGQVTERFTQAIDQLGKIDNEGNQLLEVRLGGIYALERMARESEENHWPIMEILTAYFRHHAPWPPEENQEGEQQYAAVEKSEKTPENARAVSGPAEVPAPALERVMDPGRGYCLPGRGRGKRGLRSATPPKRWVASRNPLPTAESVLPMRNPAPRPSGVVRARNLASPLRA